MLNLCAQVSKAHIGRFLKETPISNYGLFVSYEGRQGAVNREDSWGFFKDAQGFGRLDAGSQPPSTSVFQFSFFLYDVWP